MPHELSPKGDPPPAADFQPDFAPKYNWRRDQSQTRPYQTKGRIVFD